ncbi:MAG: iron-sulfur cluster-binding domain-containing protein [Coriobacteriales bacterium]|jgi:ferredoxin-NADP reductase|nr:iron-sulfur cluster-binding domain-containing protein [Coriobacteriales bacterium]
MSDMANLESLNPMGLLMITPTRMDKIEAAPNTPLASTDPITELKNALHPLVQYLIIERIIDHVDDARSYVLVPDVAKGTESLAYFSAGQYLSISLAIDGATVSKPYSISSAPVGALKGAYTITVKRSDGGFASCYILDNWKEGDSVVASGPEGLFTYEGIRDAKQVIGLAGGSGITPFLSLARAVVSGTEDFCLTLLYGSRTSAGILFKDEFDALEAACAKIKVVHILSDEEAEGYEQGFITAELIKKYAPAEDYSLFICGPQAMYNFLDAEIEKLDLPHKFIRHELFGEVKNPEKNADYPADALGYEYKLVVNIRDEKVETRCAASETLMVAMERAKVPVPTQCRSGECGFCHSYLISGDVYMPASADGRRLADSRYGYIHPCSTFPLSDVELEVPSK